jgi:hypothetical protein
MKYVPGDFFPTLPNDGAELARICLWEYARECKELREDIRSLKDAVREHFGASDPSEIACLTQTLVGMRKGGQYYILSGAIWYGMDQFSSQFYEIRDRIDNLLPQFDWHFLCSARFPGKPFLDAITKCRAEKLGSVFRTCLYPILDRRRIEIPHGQKRRKAIDLLNSRIESVVLEVGDSTETSNEFRIKESLAKISKLVEKHLGRNRSIKLHLFCFPDEFFRDYETSEIVAGFRHEVARLNQRKFLRNDGSSRKFSRMHCRGYLKWLGALRFWSLSETDKKILDRFDFDPAEEVPMSYLIGKEHGKYVKRALDFFRGLFGLGDDSLPLSMTVGLYTVTRVRSIDELRGRPVNTEAKPPKRGTLVYSLLTVSSHGGGVSYTQVDAFGRVPDC